MSKCLSATEMKMSCKSTNYSYLSSFEALIRDAWAYASVSACARVFSACARDKELTRNPTHIQGLSECTIPLTTYIIPPTFHP